MSSAFAEAHDELRAVARSLLRSGPVALSGLAEAGWLGLEVPESCGGAGATFAEVAVVLGELGRAAAVSPYLGTAVLGVGALLAVGPDPVRDELLRAVAAGTTSLAVALPPAPPGLPFRVEAVDGGWRVSGRAEFVPDAAGAERLLLVADGPGGGGPVVAAVRAGATGLDVDPQPVVDATRELATVTAEGAGAEAVWPFTGDGRAAVGLLLDRGALAVACDGLGVAEAMLEATVAYAKVRHQFGRPVGSFQAVKHACADMLLKVTLARELLAAAVADPQDGVAVARAASYVGTVAVEVAGAAMQLHGGIGYAWESGVHAYLKRAVLDRALFGSPRAHRARLAARFR